MPPAQPPLAAVREELRRLPAPIVVFNKSHSGSRLLAKALAGCGVFMGAHLNESHDSLDMLELVRYLVSRYYPDYSPLWCDTATDTDLLDLVRSAVKRHTAGFEPESGQAWGWKLCETAYVLPVIDFLFPEARFIHLLRDGRDVAFCDHVSPAEPFWRKIYFDTAGIESWRGYAMTERAYRRRTYVYNTIHWCNSVRVGRAYGAMLRERYREVRYEDLCTDFGGTMRRVLDYAGVEFVAPVMAELGATVHTQSLGKYRREPWWRLRRVIEIARPLLLSLHYLGAEGEHRQ
jgi:hypothetical protein